MTIKDDGKVKRVRYFNSNGAAVPGPSQLTVILTQMVSWDLNQMLLFFILSYSETIKLAYSRP